MASTHLVQLGRSRRSSSIIVVYLLTCSLFVGVSSSCELRSCPTFGNTTQPNTTDIIMSANWLPHESAITLKNALVAVHFNAVFLSTNADVGAIIVHSAYLTFSSCVTEYPRSLQGHVYPVPCISFPLAASGKADNASYENLAVELTPSNLLDTSFRYSLVGVVVDVSLFSVEQPNRVLLRDTFALDVHAEGLDSFVLSVHQDIPAERQAPLGRLAPIRPLEGAVSEVHNFTMLLPIGFPYLDSWFIETLVKALSPGSHAVDRLQEGNLWICGTNPTTIGGSSNHSLSGLRVHPDNNVRKKPARLRISIWFQFVNNQISSDVPEANGTIFEESAQLWSAELQKQLLDPASRVRRNLFAEPPDGPVPPVPPAFEPSPVVPTPTPHNKMSLVLIISLAAGGGVLLIGAVVGVYVYTVYRRRGYIDLDALPAPPTSSL